MWSHRVAPHHSVMGRSIAKHETLSTGRPLQNECHIFSKEYGMVQIDDNLFTGYPDVLKPLEEARRRALLATPRFVTVRLITVDNNYLLFLVFGFFGCVAPQPLDLQKHTHTAFESASSIGGEGTKLQKFQHVPTRNAKAM